MRWHWWLVNLGNLVCNLPVPQNKLVTISLHMVFMCNAIRQNKVGRQLNCNGQVLVIVYHINGGAWLIDKNNVGVHDAVPLAIDNSGGLGNKKKQYMFFSGWCTWVREDP